MNPSFILSDLTTNACVTFMEIPVPVSDINYCKTDLIYDAMESKEKKNDSAAWDFDLPQLLALSIYPLPSLHCLFNPQLSSTQLPTPTLATPTINLQRYDHPKDIPKVRTKYLFPACILITGQIHTDQTGHFPIPSSSGNKYLLILYDHDSNYIHAEPMPSRTKHQILAAYKKGICWKYRRNWKYGERRA